MNPADNQSSTIQSNIPLQNDDLKVFDETGIDAQTTLPTANILPENSTIISSSKRQGSGDLKYRGTASGTANGESTQRRVNFKLDDEVLGDAGGRDDLDSPKGMGNSKKRRRSNAWTSPTYSQTILIASILVACIWAGLLLFDVARRSESAAALLGSPTEPHEPIMLIPYLMFETEHQMYGMREAVVLAREFGLTVVRMPLLSNRRAEHADILSDGGAGGDDVSDYVEDDDVEELDAAIRRAEAAHVQEPHHSGADIASDDDEAMRRTVDGLYDFDLTLDATLVDQWVPTVALRDAHWRCKGRMKHLFVLNEEIWQKQFYRAQMIPHGLDFETDHTHVLSANFTYTPSYAADLNAFMSSADGGKGGDAHAGVKASLPPLFPPPQPKYGVSVLAQLRPMLQRAIAEIDHERDAGGRVMAREPTCIGVGYLYENVMPPPNSHLVSAVERLHGKASQQAEAVRLASRRPDLYAQWPMARVPLAPSARLRREAHAFLTGAELAHGRFACVHLPLPFETNEAKHYVRERREFLATPLTLDSSIRLKGGLHVHVGSLIRCVATVLEATRSWGVYLWVSEPHPDLQHLFRRVITTHDVVILDSGSLSDEVMRRWPRVFKNQVEMEICTYAEIFFGTTGHLSSTETTFRRAHRSTEPRIRHDLSFVDPQNATVVVPRHTLFLENCPDERHFAWSGACTAGNKLCEKVKSDMKVFHKEGELLKDKK